MDLSNLSSNWKQLQAKLKASKPAPGVSKSAAAQPPRQPSSVKRKRTDLNHRPQAQAAPRKKPRRDDAATLYKSQHQRRAKMSNGTTTATSGPNGGTAAAAAAAARAAGSAATPPAKLVNAGLSKDVEAGKYIALDCEMVGIGPQPGAASALARVSLVNFHGTQLYDSFVIPRERVTDWRTHVSGVSPSHMAHARCFADAQAAVAALLKGRVLVGHSVRNDLEVLELEHPRRDVRDTARFPPYRARAGGVSPRLKVLVAELLGLEIQGGEHSSVEDARATMMLFRRDKAGFEREHAKRWGMDRREREVGRVVAVKDVVVEEEGEDDDGGEADADADADADGDEVDAALTTTTNKKKTTAKKNKKKKKKR